MNVFFICASHWRYKRELNTIPPYTELTVQKGRQTCKQTIPIESDRGCLKNNKNRRWRKGVFSTSGFKCKIIIHFQFEGAKRYKQMENKQCYSTFLKYMWSAINNHTDTVCPPLSWALERWHRILLPMPLRNNIERVKTTTTTSILEVLKTLMGEVRQYRLWLNYAEPWPSMAIGSHWRFLWGREVTWWKLFVYHSYIIYNHI